MLVKLFNLIPIIIYDVIVDMQFKTVFSSFKDVKVIQFSSMQDAFTGFTDKASLVS